MRFMLGAIWYSYAANTYIGDMAGAGVYARALTGSEIMSHFEGIKPCKSSPLVESWNMVSTLVRGNIASLFLNQYHQCDVEVSGGCPSNVTLGSENWSGAIADIKVYNQTSERLIPRNLNALGSRLR